MLARRIATLVLTLSVLAPCLARAADYVIQPGDQLQVLVYGGQGIAGIQIPLQVQPNTTIATLSQAVVVLSDGTITYPLIGSIHVAGLTPNAAAAQIAAALATYVRKPTVSVIVQKGMPQSVKVLGAVQHGGQLELQQGDRLADAVAKAGIDVTYSDLNHITLNRIVDGVPHVFTINLYGLLLNADLSADPALLPGDIVYIPKSHQTNLANLIQLPFGLYYLYLLLTPGITHIQGTVH